MFEGVDGRAESRQRREEAAKSPLSVFLFMTKSSALRWIAAAVLLTAAVLACFWQVRNFEFLNYDDSSYLLKNPEVSRGLNLQNVRWAFTASRMSNWHPLTWLAYMGTYQIFGPNAGAFHLLNVLLHILNTLLLFG